MVGADRNIDLGGVVAGGLVAYWVLGWYDRNVPEELRVPEPNCDSPGPPEASRTDVVPSLPTSSNND